MRSPSKTSPPVYPPSFGITSDHPVSTTPPTSPATEKLALASEIIKGRERMGWTQAQLAAQSQISLSAIKGYETGRSYPGARELKQICQVLRLSPNLLLFGLESPFTGDPVDRLADAETPKGLAVQRGRISILLDLLSFDESHAIYSLVHSIAVARHGAPLVGDRLEGADLITGMQEIAQDRPFDTTLFRGLLKDEKATREIIAALKQVSQQVWGAEEKDAQKVVKK